MLIQKIAVDNIYSFKDLIDDDSLKLSSQLVAIIGPNNAGKSNLFRLIDLLIQEMESQGISLSDAHTFYPNQRRFLRLDASLTEYESEAIIHFLNYFSSNQLRRFPIANSVSLSKFFDEISFIITWDHFSFVNGRMFSATVSITFKKLGLTIRRSPPNSFDFSVDDETYQISEELMSCLNDLKTAEQFKLDIKGRCRQQIHPLEMNLSMGLKQTFSEYEIPAIEHILPFYRVDSRDVSLSFFDFIGKIFRRSIIFAGSTRKFDAEEKIGYPLYLEGDGSNISRFLFNLKVSSTAEDRTRFGCIKTTFEKIFLNKLSFEVVVNYDFSGEKARSTTEKRDAEKISIVIIDHITKKQLRINQVGTGVMEVLFYLTLSLGLKNNVLLLDEPTTNIHPILMKSLMRELAKETDTHSSNQIMIITHSSQLVKFIFSEYKPDFLYVRKNQEGETRISRLDSARKKEITDMKDKLGYTINFDLFFANGIILVEGETDKMVIEISSELFRHKDPSLDLHSKDLQIINVKGDMAFPKYRQILEGFAIPYIIIGDNHVLGATKSVAEIFRNSSIIKLTGIERRDEKTFVIDKIGKDGNLEDILMGLNKDMYSESVQYVKGCYGRGENKPVAALEFMRRLTETDSSKLGLFEELLRIICSITNQ